MKITIKTDNAAFEDCPGCEIARVLRELARDAEHGSIKSTYTDINGNKCLWIEKL